MLYHRKATSIIPKTSRNNSAQKKLGNYSSPFGDPYAHQKLSESRKIRQLHMSQESDVLSEVSDTDSAYNTPTQIK